MDPNSYQTKCSPPRSAAASRPSLPSPLRRTARLLAAGVEPEADGAATGESATGGCCGALFFAVPFVETTRLLAEVEAARVVEPEADGICGVEWFSLPRDVEDVVPLFNFLELYPERLKVESNIGNILNSRRRSSLFAFALWRGLFLFI